MHCASVVAADPAKPRAKREAVLIVAGAYPLIIPKMEEKRHRLKAAIEALKSL